jgi:hypothetical protein
MRVRGVLDVLRHHTRGPLAFVIVAAPGWGALLVRAPGYLRQEALARHVYMVPHATDKTGLLPSPPRWQAPGTRKSRGTSLGCRPAAGATVAHLPERARRGRCLDDRGRQVRPMAGVSACIATGGETITRFLRPAEAERLLLVRGIRCW